MIYYSYRIQYSNISAYSVYISPSLSPSVIGSANGPRIKWISAIWQRCSGRLCWSRRRNPADRPAVEQPIINLTTYQWRCSTYRRGMPLTKPASCSSFWRSPKEAWTSRESTDHADHSIYVARSKGLTSLPSTCSGREQKCSKWQLKRETIKQRNT